MVDDEQANIDLFVRLLSSQGYRVDSASDGEAALSLALTVKASRRRRENSVDRSINSEGDFTLGSFCTNSNAAWLLLCANSMTFRL